MKRVFDAVMSLIGHVVLSPVMAVIAIVIRRGSKGDVFARIASIGMSHPEKLAKADQGYIENRRFWSDIALIIATLTSAGAGDGAALTVMARGGVSRTPGKGKMTRFSNGQRTPIAA